MQINLAAATKFNAAKIKNKYISAAFIGHILWFLMRTVILAGIGFMILYPFIIKLVASFMSVEDLLDSTVKYIPRNPNINFIKTTIKNMDYWGALKNSFILSAVVGFAQLTVSCFSAYGFARFKFKGRNLLFLLVMITLMIPPQTVFVPLFVRFRYFGIGPWTINLVNTNWPFVLLSFTGLGLKNGLYIFMMRQFFRGMPKELEESAYIDGAGPFRTFILIIVPNAIQMMITVFLFSFTWQWTDTNYSTMFLADMKILAKSVASVASIHSIDPIVFSTLRNTACLLIIIPLLLVYVFAQRYFIQSIERSGIVG